MSDLTIQGIIGITQQYQEVLFQSRNAHQFIHVCSSIIMGINQSRSWMPMPSQHNAFHGQSRDEDTQIASPQLVVK